MKEEDEKQLGYDGNDLEQDDSANCQAANGEVFVEEKEKGEQAAHNKCGQDDSLPPHPPNQPYQKVVNLCQSIEDIEGQDHIQGI